MDHAHGLTRDQVAKLASMVGSWSPSIGVVARREFRDEPPDVILDVRLVVQSSVGIPVRVRLDRRWLDQIPAVELEPHVHRILTAVSGRNAGHELGTDDA